MREESIFVFIFPIHTCIFMSYESSENCIILELCKRIFWQCLSYSLQAASISRDVGGWLIYYMIDLRGTRIHRLCKKCENISGVLVVDFQSWAMISYFLIFFYCYDK